MVHRVKNVKNITLDPAREAAIEQFYEACDVGKNINVSHSIALASGAGGGIHGIFIDSALSAPRDSLVPRLDAHLKKTTGQGISANDFVAEDQYHKRPLYFIAAHSPDALGSVLTFLDRKKEWFTARQLLQVVQHDLSRGKTRKGFAYTLAGQVIGRMDTVQKDNPRAELFNPARWPDGGIAELAEIHRHIEREIARLTERIRTSVFRFAKNHTPNPPRDKKGVLEDSSLGKIFEKTNPDSISAREAMDKIRRQNDAMGLLNDVADLIKSDRRIRTILRREERAASAGHESPAPAR